MSTTARRHHDGQEGGTTSRREEERRQVTGVPTRDEAKRSGRGRATVISRSEKPRARFVVRLEAGQMHLAFYQEPAIPPPRPPPLPVGKRPSVVAVVARKRLDNLRIYCRGFVFTADAFLPLPPLPPARPFLPTTLPCA